MSKWVVSASLALAFILGCCFGLFFRHAPGLSLNREVRLDYILDIAATVGLAFVINQVFNPAWNRSSADRRGERALLSDVIKGAIGELSLTRATFDQCYLMNPIPMEWEARILASVQRHSNAIKSIEKAIRHCGLNEKLNFARITDLREDYRCVLTDSPFPKNFGFDPNVTMRLHNSAYVSLLDELNRIMLDLNKI